MHKSLAQKNSNEESMTNIRSVLNIETSTTTSYIILFIGLKNWGFNTHVRDTASWI